MGLGLPLRGLNPAPQRVRGYYALPLLWRDQVIGWGNLAVAGGVLGAELGYVAGRPPREAVFRRELDAELSRLAQFLGLAEGAHKLMLTTR